ncbi:SRPBCC family protein [Streptomyces liangshanensis]|uniref:SRPBCC family protein n=1 Tax=Streptomyces liangshanensis TaxID=2717324 RepID=UPI0036D87947
MAAGTLTHRFTVPAPRGHLVAHLGDPANYVTLNPYVTEVSGVHERDGAVEFTAIERIRLLGPVHRNNRLSLVIRSEADHSRTVYDVTSPGGITVRIATEFTETPGGTDVLDTITLDVPWPIRRFALRQARFAQLHRADILARLDRGTSSLA